MTQIGIFTIIGVKEMKVIGNLLLLIIIAICIIIFAS